jgi:response regulator RpfG family c-di-GMP phosphodiesterase
VTSVEAGTGIALAKDNFLGALPGAALDDLLSRGERKSYSAGERLFSAGDPGRSLHVVVSGAVNILREGDLPTVLLQRVEPGQLFGKIALLQPGPRTASAVAAQDTVTTEIDRDDLLAVIDANREAVPALLGAMARSLTDAHEAVTLRADDLEKMVQERTAEVHETQLEVIRRLGRAAEYRDDDTGIHIVRMSKFSTRLARAVGASEREIVLIQDASQMHDIGKIGVPDRVLLKPGKLDADEWELMKAHSVIGSELLDGSRSEIVQLAQMIALSHHEKWDGSGYPNGLAREQIPLPARICTVADVFDALMSPRPYKKPWTLDQAVEEIRKCGGSHFDPDLARVFADDVIPESEDLLALYEPLSA